MGISGLCNSVVGGPQILQEDQGTTSHQETFHFKVKYINLVHIYEDLSLFF